MLQFRHMQQRAALCAMFVVLAAALAAAPAVAGNRHDAPTTRLVAPDTG